MEENLVTGLIQTSLKSWKERVKTIMFMFIIFLPLIHLKDVLVVDGFVRVIEKRMHLDAQSVDTKTIRI